MLHPTINADTARRRVWHAADHLEVPVVTQERILDEVSRSLRKAVELHLADEDLEALGLSPDPTIIGTMELTPQHA